MDVWPPPAWLSTLHYFLEERNLRHKHYLKHIGGLKDLRQAVALADTDTYAAARKLASGYLRAGPSARSVLALPVPEH